jgi:hypothetical protein
MSNTERSILIVMTSYLFILAIIYWIGFLAGWYATHPLGAPPSNWNPDSYIHAGLFQVPAIVSALLVAMVRRKRLERRASVIAHGAGYEQC